MHLSSVPHMLVPRLRHTPSTDRSSNI
jgi:hypothetical protein